MPVRSFSDSKIEKADGGDAETRFHRADPPTLSVNPHEANKFLRFYCIPRRRPGRGRDRTRSLNAIERIQAQKPAAEGEALH
jgi:hypothetical protein